MTKRTDSLFQEIEAGTLDHRSPIGDLLRKVIALGGRARSAELRDRAPRELRGYGWGDELPPYRHISAPLQMDAGTMTETADRCRVQSMDQTHAVVQEWLDAFLTGTAPTAQSKAVDNDS